MCVLGVHRRVQALVEVHQSARASPLAHARGGEEGGGGRREPSPCDDGVEVRFEARHCELDVGARLVQEVPDHGVRQDVGGDVSPAQHGVFDNLDRPAFLQLLHDRLFDAAHLEERVLVGADQHACYLLPEEADVCVQEPAVVEFRQTDGRPVLAAVPERARVEQHAEQQLQVRRMQAVSPWPDHAHQPFVCDDQSVQERRGPRFQQDLVDALAVGLAHFDTLKGGEQDLRGATGHCVREPVEEDFGAAEETAEVEVFARREDLVELAEGEGRKDLGVEGVQLGSQLEALGMEGSHERHGEREGCGTCESDSPIEEMATRYSGPSATTANRCPPALKHLSVSLSSWKNEMMAWMTPM